MARSLQDILPGILSRTNEYDQTGDWPADDLRNLHEVGAMRWAVPAEFGGEDISSLDLHLRYEQIAAASLSTALVLSQRDSAIGLIDGGDNAALREQLLPRLVRNEMLATIGIAQLTTSRQGGIPALRATQAGDRWKLDGMIPWSTGAGKASYVIAGAAVEQAGAERVQILFALPTDLPGVTVDPPMPLVALRSSHTSTIRCEGALLAENQILKGPQSNVLSVRRRTVPLGQAFLAMGLCRGGINLIDAHDSDLARKASETFSQRLRELRCEVIEVCRPEVSNPEAIPRLRGAVNELALSITHAAVAIYKGSALLPEHPAQRLAREAMFLLVWSCPNPVIDCTVELLSGRAS